MEIILIVLLVLAFPGVFVALFCIVVLVVRYTVMAAVFVGIPVVGLMSLKEWLN